jgi:hypothetical protein
VRGCGSPEHVEAEACLEGVRLAAEWIRLPTRVESDCKTLITGLERKNDIRSAWACILAEIQAIGNILPDRNFIHIHRDMNQLAHNLAQKAIRQNECVVMRFDAPACVRQLMASEAVNSQKKEKLLSKEKICFKPAHKNYDEIKIHESTSEFCRIRIHMIFFIVLRNSSEK